MPTFTKEVVINAPAQKVFEYLADFSRHPEWAGTPLEINLTSDPPVGVGTTFSSTGKQFGTHTDQVKVVEFQAPTAIVIETVGDAGTNRHSFLLTEEGGTTRLTKVFDLVAPTKTTGFFARIRPGIFNKGVQGDVDRIKAHVEGSAI